MTIGTSAPVSYAINAYGRANQGLPVDTMPLAQPEGGADTSSTDTSFLDLLGNALSTSIDTGYKGEGMKTAALGNKVELHDLITGVTDLELTLKTIVAFRDRFISAYNDIIKMPI